MGRVFLSKVFSSVFFAAEKIIIRSLERRMIQEGRDRASKEEEDLPRARASQSRTSVNFKSPSNSFALEIRPTVAKESKRCSFSLFAGPWPSAVWFIGVSTRGRRTSLLLAKSARGASMKDCRPRHCRPWHPLPRHPLPRRTARRKSQGPAGGREESSASPSPASSSPASVPSRASTATTRQKAAASLPPYSTVLPKHRNLA